MSEPVDPIRRAEDAFRDGLNTFADSAPIPDLNAALTAITAADSGETLERQVAAESRLVTTNMDTAKERGTTMFGTASATTPGTANGRLRGRGQPRTDTTGPKQVRPTTGPATPRRGSGWKQWTAAAVSLAVVMVVVVSALGLWSNGRTVTPVAPTPDTTASVVPPAATPVATLGVLTQVVSPIPNQSCDPQAAVVIKDGDPRGADLKKNPPSVPHAGPDVLPTAAAAIAAAREASSPTAEARSLGWDPAQHPNPKAAAVLLPWGTVVRVMSEISESGDYDWLDGAVTSFAAGASDGTVNYNRCVWLVTVQEPFIRSKGPLGSIPLAYSQFTTVLDQASGQGLTLTAGPGVPDALTGKPTVVTNSYDVDPQILADVVSYAFPTGGPSILRQMRVEQAVFSIQADDCGGKYRFDPDYTGSRTDQVRLPYLDLIAEKGFSEPEPDFGDRYDSREACASRSLPSLLSVLRLGTEWDQVVTEVWNRPAIQATLTPAGQCLESKTGRHLGTTGAEKVEGFFGLLTRIDLTAEGMKLHAGYYATCMADYSAAMQVALRVEAGKSFAANRDVLVKFAQELEAAGYVP